MKVFISWSGQRSRQIAEILHGWFPKVIQAVDPYFSPEDIEKGSRWDSEISKELDGAQIGLLCLTPENLKAPWLLFEAGALSKDLNKSRVCPILFDLEPTNIEYPLARFQAAKFQRDEMFRVVNMINSGLGESALKPRVLEGVFEKWWPDLESQIRGIGTIPVGQLGEVDERTDHELLVEVLSLLRTKELSASPVHDVTSNVDELIHALQHLVGMVDPLRTPPLKKAVADLFSPLWSLMLLTDSTEGWVDMEAIGGVLREWESQRESAQ